MDFTVFNRLFLEALFTVNVDLAVVYNQRKKQEKRRQKQKRVDSTHPSLTKMGEWIAARGSTDEQAAIKMKSRIKLSTTEISKKPWEVLLVNADCLGGENDRGAREVLID